MKEESIPFNKVGAQAPDDVGELAQSDGVTEMQWRAKNLPATALEFRWRYTNKTIHLYERRLRSLASFNVGPSVQAWVRSRLEWVRDNRFRDMPQGIIILTIDPDGDVDIRQEPIGEAPVFERGAKAPGTLWAAKGNVLYMPVEIKHAADTLVRDLAKTLGFDLVGQSCDRGDAGVFAVSDEFGIIAREDNKEDAVEKLTACFDKLWTLDTR